MRSHIVESNNTKNIRLPFNGLYHSFLGELLFDELTSHDADILSNLLTEDE